MYFWGVSIWLESKSSNSRVKLQLENVVKLATERKSNSFFYMAILTFREIFSERFFSTSSELNLDRFDLKLSQGLGGLTKTVKRKEKLP